MKDCRIESDLYRECAFGCSATWGGPCSHRSRFVSAKRGAYGSGADSSLIGRLAGGLVACRLLSRGLTVLIVSLEGLIRLPSTGA